MSGIALVMKAASPAIQTVGVSMECAPVMVHSLRAGKPVEMEEEDTLADALVGNIGLNNQYTFRMVQEYVDDVALVSEAEIARAMAFALKKHGIAVEGGGAVGIGALLHDKTPTLGQQIAIVISGGNVGIPQLMRTLKE
jgi:threonine dehydratase